MAKRSKKKKAVLDGVSDEVPASTAVQAAIVSRGSSLWDRDWPWGLLLLLAVMVVYSPVCLAGYVWDDITVVTGNPVIVGPLGLKEIWTTSAADICPLTLTTFWLGHKLWGLAPLPYHLVTVLLHAANAWVLWRVLRSLRVPGAWLGAALWALHPVQVESVAWVSEMKNTESGLFFLLTMLFFVKTLETSGVSRHGGGNWNYGWTMLFAALAIAGKSSTVILPLVLLLAAWWKEGRWHWRHLAKVAPIIIMAVAASIVTMWMLKARGASDPLWARSFLQRLLAGGDAVWFYLGKLLWPYPLMAIYPRWQIETSQGLSYLPLLAAVMVLFILWLNRGSRSRPWFFAFAYFLAALLPVLGFFDNYIYEFSLVFDHFQYLASMGPLALAGAGMVWLATLIIPERRGLQSSLAAGVLLLLGVLSWQRAWVYQSQETLWTDAVAKNPNCWEGYFNLGRLLSQEGKVDEAIERYQEALNINPNYTKALNNLGNAVMREQQVDDAILQYQKALKNDPNNAEAHCNLGAALAGKGQISEAIAQYQQAMALNPYLAETHYNLGLLLGQSGNLDEAMQQFQLTLEINPNLAEAHNELGDVLLRKGQINEAMAQFQAALALKPGYSDAQNNLAKAMAMQKLNPK